MLEWARVGGLPKRNPPYGMPMQVLHRSRRDSPVNARIWLEASSCRYGPVFRRIDNRGVIGNRDAQVASTPNTS